MTHSSLKREVRSLRHQNSQRLLETLVVFVASFMATAYVPSLLIRYYYANQQLTAQPPLLDMIPVVAFAISVAYLAFAAITNFFRSMKIARLEKELDTMADSCGDGCCCNCGDGHSHSHSDSDMPSMGELEQLVNEALSEAETMSKPSTKKTAKRKAKARSRKSSK